MRKKVELTENAEMLVDANIQLPNATKNVLGALIFASGAYTEHRKENNNWFYKDADSLIEESQVSKKTFSTCTGGYDRILSCKLNADSAIP